MKVQFPTRRGDLRSLRFDAPFRLARQAGELRVREGAVWLTRRNDLQDHLLRAGERLRLAAGDAAVIEPWLPGQAASVDWQPIGVPAAAAQLLRAAIGHGLGSLAAAASRLATALRRAEAGMAGGAH